MNHKRIDQLLKQDLSGMSDVENELERVLHCIEEKRKQIVLTRERKQHAAKKQTERLISAALKTWFERLAFIKVTEFFFSSTSTSTPHNRTLHQ